MKPRAQEHNSEILALRVHPTINPKTPQKLPNTSRDHKKPDPKIKTIKRVPTLPLHASTQQSTNANKSRHKRTHARSSSKRALFTQKNRLGLYLPNILNFPIALHLDHLIVAPTIASTPRITAAPFANTSCRSVSAERNRP